MPVFNPVLAAMKDPLVWHLTGTHMTNEQREVGRRALRDFAGVESGHRPNNLGGMKLGQFHYYPSSVCKRRRKLLSDELLLVLAVGLTIGALGIWLILRVLN